MPRVDDAADPDDPERQYYLASFRDRVLVVAAATPAAVVECRAVAAELAAAGARVIVVVPGERVEPIGDADLLDVWRRLGSGPRELSHVDPPAAAAAIAVGGRVHKLVVVDDELVVTEPDGERRSFVDVGRAGLPAALAAVARPLYEGVDGVNLVAAGGLARELLTYEGAGTLLTRGEYGEVRPLGFADYGPVADLLRRGVALGYLRPRPDAEMATLLPRAIGFFAAGDHPAGVVALATEPYAGTGVGELEALFGISRFHGEGMGRRLVDAVAARGHERGLTSLFAATTHEDAGRFFTACGFREVGTDAVPGTKWRGYPEARRAAVRTFVLDL